MCDMHAYKFMPTLGTLYIVLKVRCGRVKVKTRYLLCTIFVMFVGFKEAVLPVPHRGCVRSVRCHDDMGCVVCDGWSHCDEYKGEKVCLLQAQ